MTTEDIGRALLEGVRRAREAAEMDAPIRILVQGAAFALRSVAIRLPQGDPERLRLENLAVMVLSVLHRPREQAVQILRLAEESLP